MYVGPHVGTCPVLELGPIFRPVLKLGRGRPHLSPYWHSLSKIDLVPIWGQS